jgi:SecD/SecF fusion protein
MKTYFIIVAIIIASFSFGGCIAQENSNYKITVVPESKISGITLNEMNTAGEIICKRLNNSFDIPLESIKTEVTENQVILTIRKADTDRIASYKELISDYTRLEFWETYENREMMGYMSKANNWLKEMKGGAEANDFISQNQLPGILKLRVNEKGEPLPSCMIGLVSGKDTAVVNRYMQIPEIKALLPRDLKLMWSLNPHKHDTSKTLYELHAIKVTTRDGKAPLDESAIVSANITEGSGKSGVKIDLKMSGEGARTWAGITRGNINRCIAIVLNGSVRSYPRVMTEITGGNTEITGDFTSKEANDLVNILKSGELPFKLKIIDEQIVKE